MPSYRVSFFNELARGKRIFCCCQRTIFVRSAKSPDRAIEAAKKRFIRLEQVRDWRIRAAAIEVETIAGDAGAPAAEPAAGNDEGASGARDPTD